jgi:hypothetical protein
MGEHNAKNVQEGDVFRPGSKVQASGIYECDSPGCDHQWSTNVKGHTFPPMQHGCDGRGWRLRNRTPTDG